MISKPATTGAKLTSDLRAHMGQYNLKIREGLSVRKITPGSIKTLTLSTGETIEATAVIIATGANWRELNIPGEKENIGSGVAYCPHCDGPFFKDKDIAVVGGGNSGVEAALDLSAIAKSVTLLEYMPTLKADAILVDRASQRENIELLTNVECLEVLSNSKKVSGLRYADRETLKKIDLNVAGVFVQIGLIPNSHFLPEQVEVNKFREIVVNHKGETSADGIFACGDVTTVPYKQIVIAMGDGANVALATAEYVMARQPLSQAV
jgi:alkyl hydroperoxide reductase subunit F